MYQCSTDLSASWRISSLIIGLDDYKRVAVGVKPVTVGNLEMILDEVQGDDVGYAIIVKSDFLFHKEDTLLEGCFKLLLPVPALVVMFIL